MRGARANGLLAALLTACALVAAYRALHAAPDPELVARWWPATVLMTMLFLLRPRREARGLTFLMVVGFFAMGVLAGRDGLFSIGYAVANAVEVLVVLWVLTRFEEGRPELRLWPDYRRWLIGIFVGSVTCAALTAAAFWATTNEFSWRTLMWVSITHLGAQAIGLPLVMRQSRYRIQVSPAEIGAHLVLLGAALTACGLADAGQPVAFLLLPVLMWGAARFTHVWANIELTLVASLVIVATALGQGPFLDIAGDAELLTIAASAQVFLAISAITAVAFSVATSHLRDSLRRNREHELQLGQLLDSASGTAFIATDLDGVITLFSPGAEQLLGYTSAELVGRSTPIAFHDAREVVARAHELDVPATTYDVVTRPVEQGQEQDTRDWTYLRKDGSRLSVSLSVTAVRDDEGRPTGYFSVVRDVTDRRAAEEALRTALDKEREANRQMHAVDRAKDDFVSTVSHELRTPLTSIIGYTELLNEGLTGALTRIQHDLVEKIDRNGSRLLQLVEDLLTLSRIEHGEFQLERVPTDLRDPVRSAIDQVAAIAAQQDVAITVSLPPRPVTVVGDAEHLQRLAHNLINNAVKFSEAGGTVTIALQVRHHLASLVVSDTGMGIPLEEQTHLFKRFFRSSVATEKAVQGTGLGLNIVHSIAIAHGGDVDFSSTPGEGSSFRFTVPLKGPVALVEELDPPVPNGVPAEHVDSIVGDLLSPRHRAEPSRSDVS